MGDITPQGLALGADPRLELPRFRVRVSRTG